MHKRDESATGPDRSIDLGEMTHVGIAVRDIGAAIAALRGLGLQFGVVWHVEVPSIYRGADTRAGIKGAFSQGGPVVIELVEPTGGQSAVATFVSEQGEGVQHLGYRIPDVAAAIAEAEALGFKAEWTVDDEHGLAVAFLPPGAFFGISIELVRSEPPVDLQKWMK